MASLVAQGARATSLGSALQAIESRSGCRRLADSPARHRRLRATSGACCSPIANRRSRPANGGLPIARERPASSRDCRAGPLKFGPLASSARKSVPIPSGPLNRDAIGAQSKQSGQCRTLARLGSEKGFILSPVTPSGALEPACRVGCARASASVCARTFAPGSVRLRACALVCPSASARRRRLRGGARQPASQPACCIRTPTSLRAGRALESSPARDCADLCSLSGPN